jgi:hypothetical protein
MSFEFRTFVNQFLTLRLEIVLVNPLYSPIMGDFIVIGGHPQALGRKRFAPLLVDEERYGDGVILSYR